MCVSGQNIPRLVVEKILWCFDYFESLFVLSRMHQLLLILHDAYAMVVAKPWMFVVQVLMGMVVVVVLMGVIGVGVVVVVVVRRFFVIILILAKVICTHVMLLLFPYQGFLLWSRHGFSCSYRIIHHVVVNSLRCMITRL